MSNIEPADLPPEVIERALAGDEEAFKRFYRRYDPTVRWAVGRRVYRWPKLVSNFDDIVQDVWLELTRCGCKRLRYHDMNRGLPFWRFLALVSTRFAWRIAKRKLDHPIDELEGWVDEGCDFTVKIMHADFLNHLARRVEEELGETERRLFFGYYVRGEQLKDVGAELGMKEDATYKRKERLQKKLNGMAEELLAGPIATSPEVVAMVLGAMLSIGPSGLWGAI